MYIKGLTEHKHRVELNEYYVCFFYPTKCSIVKNISIPIFGAILLVRMNVKLLYSLKIFFTLSL